MIDIRYDRALGPQSLFPAAHFVLSVRKRQGMGPEEGEPGHQCVPVQGQSVVTFRIRFHTRAFVQRQIARSKHIIQLERIGELTRNVPIGCASHPVIHLGQ